jgi:hypothetical protein
MTVKVTQLNPSGFSAVAGDPLAAVTEDGSTAFSNFIPTVYEAAGFSVDLKFEGAYASAAEPPEITYQNATAVSLTTNVALNGLVATKPNAYTYRISGAWANAFTNSYYQFKMKDYSLKVLPPTTTEDWIALIRYQMPSPTSIQKDIVFSVTIPADPILGGAPTTENVTMSQWVFWNFASARASVINLVGIGEK